MSFKTVVITLLLTLNLFAKERVVSLSPSITEILFALNKGEDIVATSEFSLYPNEATALPKIGSYTNPNIEKIISYEPTLVIGQEFHKKSLQESKRFGIKSIELNLKTVEAIRESINKLS
ncbi:MAG: helical backbone metal receptor, partial [Campylobacterota bacterium]|nr:helical backbone metal receptor [Campylobacterota bacterium]